MVLPFNNHLSLFPDLPRESPAIDKDGNFTFLWALGFASLFQALQDNFSDEGVKFPGLNSTDIASIQSRYSAFIGLPLPPELDDISGQAVFDTDNRVSKQFVITYDGATPPNIVTAQWRTFMYV